MPTSLVSHYVKLPPAITGIHDLEEGGVGEVLEDEIPMAYSSLSNTERIFRDSWMLDGGANEHIVNSLEQFTKDRDAEKGERMRSGNSFCKILAHGTATMRIEDDDG